MIRKIFKGYKVEVSLFFIAFFIYVFYACKYLSTEVLFLASFEGDIQLVGKLLSDTITINDFFSKYGEHGLFGYNILLLLNANFFSYTSNFDLYINIVNVLLVSSILLFAFIKNNFNNKKDFFYYFSILLIVLFSFSTMQGISATMETQVRLGLLFFVISSYFINESIIDNKLNKNFYFSIISIFFAVNIFGTLYNFAAYPIIFLTLTYLIFWKNNKVSRYLLLIYTITLCLYFFEYSLVGTKGKSNLLESLIFLTLNPNFLFNVISGYYASSVLGWSTYTDNIISSVNYLRIGYIILCINLIATFLFFKSRMYEKTYLPIFLQGYTLFVIVLAIVGRSQFASWDWGINYWYHVHTKVGLIASVWIIYYAKNYIEFKYKKSIGIFIFVSFLILLLSMLFGVRNDFNRAPYVKNWYENFQRWMYVDINDMPIDSKSNQTPLLATYDLTKNGLEILKKYKLSVFSIIYQNKIDKKTIFLSGKLYDDNWISKMIKVNLNTSNKGILNIDLFLPNEYFTPNSLNIIIDGKSIGIEYIRETGMHHLVYKTEPNKNVVLEAIFEKSMVPSKLGVGVDEREISAIVNKFEFE